MNDSNGSAVRVGGRGVTRVVLAALAVVAGGGVEAGATILTFDQVRSGTGALVVPIVAGADLPQDYGDRVTGSPMSVPGGAFTYGVGSEGFTPNVLVDYLSAGFLSLWTTDYGDLSNVAFGSQRSGSYDILLTADAGHTVELYGFDLAGWSRTDYTINAVSVGDDGGALFTLSNALIQGNATGPMHTAFAFASPLSASRLRITVDYANLPVNSQDNIGIDNIRFGQTPGPTVEPGPDGEGSVPEPALWQLVALGVAGWRCRRR